MISHIIYLSMRRIINGYLNNGFLELKKENSDLSPWSFTLLDKISKYNTCKIICILIVESTILFKNYKVLLSLSRFSSTKEFYLEKSNNKSCALRSHSKGKEMCLFILITSNTTIEYIFLKKINVIRFYKQDFIDEPI